MADPPPSVEVHENAYAVMMHAARWLTEEAVAAVRDHGRFSIALAGGSTPKGLYRVIAQPPFESAFPWRCAHLFWGDERFVPHDHPDSNYLMARRALIDHAPIPAENIHPMPTDGSAHAAAERYQEVLSTFLGRSVLDPAHPLFDVVLLGIGPDGHTASLFPGSPVLEERTAWVKAVEGAKPETRLTLTYKAIASSRNVAFLVTGEEKREIVGRILGGDMELPAARVTSEGRIRWFLDHAAAGDTAN